VQVEARQAASTPDVVVATVAGEGDGDHALDVLVPEVVERVAARRRAAKRGLEDAVENERACSRGATPTG
jgi:hypothetical protein